MSWTLAFSAKAYSRSDHAQLFKIVIPDLEGIGDMLSGTLSTVEELVGESIPKRHNQLGGLLHYVQRVIIVQVSSEWRLTLRIPFS